VSLELTHPYLLHPRTGEPLQAVGIVAGRPVWPILGGDGSEGDANEGGSEGDNGEGDEGAGNDGDGGDEGHEDEGDQDEAGKSRANRQAARYRTQLREAEKARDANAATLDRLRKAITGDDGDGEADAGELASQVEQLTTRTSQLESQLLVHELAAQPELNANPVALLDSNSFTRELHGLDPADDDYRDQVAEAIKNAVAKNRNYRAGQGSSRGGGELDRERREQRAKRPTSLAAAIGKHYGS